MDTNPTVNRRAWRAQARADLRRPRFWAFIGCLYGATFLLVAVTMLVLELVVPHLPWISKPYVSSDPPPLVTAFYCANFMLVAALVMIPFLYLCGPTLKIRFLPSNKNE